MVVLGLLAAIATLLRGEPDALDPSASDDRPGTTDPGGAEPANELPPAPLRAMRADAATAHPPATAADPATRERRAAADPAEETFGRVRPVPSPDGRGEVAAGELLVLPRDGRGAQLEATLRAELEVVAVRELPVAGARRVRLAPGASLGDAIARARALPGVADATANAIVRGTGEGRGRRDAASERRRPASRQVSRASWNARAMHLPSYRQDGRAGTARTVVALLDSGAAVHAHAHDHGGGSTHGVSPGLRDAELVAPFDAIDDDAQPDDHNGHGTFLANLLVGRPGLARSAALMPVRVLDDDLVGTEASLVAGLSHAVMHGADVINLSLVFGERYLPTRLLDAAIMEALDSGAVVVAAAGNDGEGQVRYPAAFRDVVAVGATTPAGPRTVERAHYSSVGPALDVLAPGGDLDADRNRDGIADGVIAESFDPQTPGTYGPWLYAGTSQAAAHASAAVTWLLAEGVAPDEVAERLRGGARDMAEPRFDEATGAGALDVLRAVRRAHRPAELGVQLVAVLRDAERGPAVGAVVTVVDRESEPVPGATVHALFRASRQQSARCTTDADGVCVLDGMPLDGTRLAVVVQAHAVVLRDGRVVRPLTVAPAAQIDRALSESGGTGFGSSSSLWLVDPTYSSFWWSGSLASYQLYGSGEGSSLAPTVVCLDEASMEQLTGEDDTGGTGFGSSSLVWSFYYWDVSYFLAWGGGFGSSSLVWSGWSFQWSGWGSGIFDATAASLESEAASHDSAAASHDGRAGP